MGFYLLNKKKLAEEKAALAVEEVKAWAKDEKHQAELARAVARFQAAKLRVKTGNIGGQLAQAAAQQQQPIWKSPADVPLYARLDGGYFDGLYVGLGSTVLLHHANQDVKFFVSQECRVTVLRPRTPGATYAVLIERAGHPVAKYVPHPTNKSVYPIESIPGTYVEFVPEAQANADPFKEEAPKPEHNPFELAGHFGPCASCGSVTYAKFAWLGESMAVTCEACLPPEIVEPTEAEIEEFGSVDDDAEQGEFEKVWQDVQKIQAAAKQTSPLTAAGLSQAFQQAFQQAQKKAHEEMRRQVDEYLYAPDAATLYVPADKFEPGTYIAHVDATANTIKVTSSPYVTTPDDLVVMTDPGLVVSNTTAKRGLVGFIEDLNEP